ncbi:MAG: hypothetical protein ACR2P8_04100 [Myxococcota bacterium]
MRSYQVFAAMSPERAADVLHVLNEKAPGVYVQAVAAASAAMKARPKYLMRQPAAKRAQAVRRALARVSANPVAGEILAVYFLECRKELLVSWLDTVGLEHDEGALAADAPPQPDKGKLDEAVDRFLGLDEDPDRMLLLAAFAAQDAIEWPDLVARLTLDG